MLKFKINLHIQKMVVYLSKINRYDKARSTGKNRRTQKVC